MRSFTAGKLWLILGSVGEQMSHEQIAGAEPRMPEPVLRLRNQTSRSPFVTELRG